MSFFNLFFLIFIYTFSFFALAKVRVEGSVNTNTISPQDILVLNVEVHYTSEDNIEISNVSEQVKPFNIVSTNTSSQIQIINGSMSKKKVFRYMLRPLKEGKFRINPIEAIVDGKSYKTQALEIEVSSKVPTKPRRRQQGLGRFFHPFFDDEDRHFQPFSRSIQEKDISLQLELSKKKVYLGEMLSAKWFIYSPAGQRINLQNEIKDPPKLDGFWVESTFFPGLSPPVDPQLGELEGKQYNKQLIIAYALFPVRTGVLDIGSLNLKSRNFTSFSLFGSPKSFIRKTDKKSIEVLPLPEEGKGSLFTEAVGDYNVLAKINKSIVGVKEPVIYKIQFKGVGHPRIIRLPDLNFGDQFEVYDQKESQKFSVKQSEKTFEITLIPKTNGELKIPSFEVSTFDPNLGVYKTHVLPAFNLQVKGVLIPDSAKENTDERYFDQDRKNVEDKLQTGNTDKKKKDIFTPLTLDNQLNYLKHFRSIVWWVIYGSLSLFLLIAILKERFLFTKDKSKFQIKADLKKVDQAIKNKSWKQAAIELNQILYSFFADLSGQNKVVKDWDTLLCNIHPSIRINYEKEVRELISQLEIISFAPLESSSQWRNKKHLEALKNKLIALLKKIHAE